MYVMASSELLPGSGKHTRNTSPTLVKGPLISPARFQLEAPCLRGLTQKTVGKIKTLSIQDTFANVFK